MHLTNRTIVTGVGSGLGKFIHNSLPNSVGIDRSNHAKIMREAKNQSYDLIIHCAFDPKHHVEDYYKYFKDNLQFTQELLEIPHKKFIYLSTIDVYREENSSYKFTKLMAESIVENNCINHLIVRCSALLGPTMRENTFLKLMNKTLTKTGLSKDSEFNYVLYEDIYEFFVQANNKNLVGIFNLVSKDNISLQEVSDYFGCTPQFGDFTYTTPLVKGNIPVEVSSINNRTSLDNIKRFKTSYGK